MKRSLPALPQSRPRVTQLEVTQLVVIGASAGAVEPLRTLVAGFRPDGKTAYCIAQHVSPEHETLLPQLLQPRAAIAVQLASPNPHRCVWRPTTFTSSPPPTTPKSSVTDGCASPPVTRAPGHTRRLTVSS
ncbi:chemotaxis protein CheB [Hydrogenophilus thermoluteolus]|uniref:chemotaxis protein CheB n=1 Tax=Hydrogenophilus thermoluteolus TaxID=297 RepID=UPI003F67794A